MKPLYILVCLLFAVFASVDGYAQTNFGFTYDASGNRVTRAVIQMKSAIIPTDTLDAKQAVKPLEYQIGLQKTRIYPNPTKGMLRVDFPELTEQGATISVFDPNGKLIMQEPGVATGNEVDLSAHPTGFYIMVIHIGQEKKEWKIIKE